MSIIMIIIMYIYQHVLINALSAHTICINLIFHIHVKQVLPKTIYRRYYMETHARTHTHISKHGA